MTIVWIFGSGRYYSAIHGAKVCRRVMDGVGFGGFGMCFGLFGFRAYLALVSGFPGFASRYV